MRNSTRGSTPKANPVQDESVSNAEKSSAKKLRQARLPFKVIDPASSPVGSKSTTPPVADKDKNAVKDTHSTDGRKRKLSFDTDDDGANIVMKEDDNVSKENVEVLAAAAKKKKLTAVSSNDTTTEVVSLLDDDENDEDSKVIPNSSVGNVAGKKVLNLETPKSSIKDKNKGAGTPQTSSAQNSKNGSATKLKIKLPLSAGKKKRRKSNLNQLPLKNSAAENSLNQVDQTLSNDDIEEIAAELNPQKRKKINIKDDETKTIEKKSTVGQKQKLEAVVLDSETDEEIKEKLTETEKSKKVLSGNGKLRNDSNKTLLEHCDKIKTASLTTDTVEQPEPKPCKESTSVKSSSDCNTKNVFEKLSDNDDDEKILISDSSDENNKQKDDKEDPEESVLSDNDNEADDETDNLAGKALKVSSDIAENSNSKNNNAVQSLKDGRTSTSSSKNLTPKQIRLMEQRRKAREEKERKLQEEKMKKQQDKEEKEVAKKREREEKDELKRKEREEKDEQKRKEREEKERKRLADIEAKNEEKRKKNEAKEEDLRKKEEERKRKEHEKEEAELKKKKAAQAFTKFFVAKTPTSVQLKTEEDSNTGDGTKILAFRPFQIKGDMKLAPILRKNFTAEAKSSLDDLLGCKNEHEVNKEIVRCKPLPKNQLYLSDLRSGKISPGKWRRPSTESKDDVIILEDELERVGQAIVEDTPAYVREEMRVKFYKFHDNRRPPYYGTWRKKSAVVKPRKPLAQDKKFFDYEVDSDDEWEEEEPGESLEDGSDEDKEKESEDDDYEVDNEWFVPHGHLSDEELQNEDEFGMGDDNTREAQKAKLQLLQQEFAQEMKKKTEKIKPRLIGCIWTAINGNQPPECAKMLWDTLEKKAMLFSDPILIEEPEVDRSSEANSPSTASNSNTDKTSDKLKPISLSDNMVKDLTRLVHGNNHAKNFLINEYIAYVEKTEESIKNGGLRKPLKSVVRDKIDEIAEWQAVDATASSIQEIEQSNDESNDKKKKKVKRRLCWVVKQEMLDKMDLSSLKLKNSWKYTLPPKFVKAEKEVKKDEGTAKQPAKSISSSAEESAKEKNSAISQTKLAKEKITKSESASSSANTSSTNKSDTGTKSNQPATSKEKKRVPLLMSVARGQQISTPAKTKLISQFLQQKNKVSVKPSSPRGSTRSNAVTLPNVEDDDVVILD